MGVKSIQALRDGAFWMAFAAGSWEAGGWDDQLLDAALARSHMLTPAKSTYNHIVAVTVIHPQTSHELHAVLMTTVE